MWTTRQIFFEVEHSVQQSGSSINKFSIRVCISNLNSKAGLHLCLNWLILFREYSRLEQILGTKAWRNTSKQQHMHVMTLEDLPKLIHSLPMYMKFLSNIHCIPTRNAFRVYLRALVILKNRGHMAQCYRLAWLCWQHGLPCYPCYKISDFGPRDKWKSNCDLDEWWPECSQSGDAI